MSSTDRSTLLRAWGTLTGVVVASLLAVGCNDDAACAESGSCSADGGAGGSSVTTTTSTMSSGGGGEGGSIDPGCIPSMLPAGEQVPAECGLFVQAGASGSGTKDSPTGDLQNALSSVDNAKAVYICGTDMFTGSFTLAGGRSIFVTVHV